jgi:hypothetical protein
MSSRRNRTRYQVFTTERTKTGSPVVIDCATLAEKREAEREAKAAGTYESTWDCCDNPLSNLLNDTLRGR